MASGPSLVSFIAAAWGLLQCILRTPSSIAGPTLLGWTAWLQVPLPAQDFHVPSPAAEGERVWHWTGGDGWTEIHPGADEATLFRVREANTQAEGHDGQILFRVDWTVFQVFIPNARDGGPLFWRVEGETDWFRLGTASPLSARHHEWIRVWTQTPRVVRFLYLVPSDRTAVPEFASAIEQSAHSLREWFSGQLGGPTFRLHTPVVEIHSTPNPSSHYSANPSLEGDWWDRAFQDAGLVAGVRWGDPYNIWVVYVDSSPACGQRGGSGWNHVALMPREDLLGLSQMPIQNACGEDLSAWGVNRWIGGAGHELGHAFNIPHPPGCEAGLDTCDAEALMWIGFSRYPDSYFRPGEKEILDASPFIGPEVAPLGMADGWIVLGDRLPQAGGGPGITPRGVVHEMGNEPMGCTEARRRFHLHLDSLSVGAMTAE